MDIEYKVNAPITTAQFLSVLNSSGLAERRPVDDLACIQGMVEHSNLLISAWHNDELIGIARSLTDFHYACYLSDLAVDKRFQSKGIGKALQELTHNEIGPRCKLILIAAPNANSYYENLGYQTNTRCWVKAP